MKASFMLTTHRQNCNLRNGIVLGLQDPKKHVCKKANWRWCWFVSLTNRGSYTGNLSHLEWRSMQTSTVMFEEDYVKMCGARGHRNGKTRTSLSSTTTMPRLTRPLKFRSFWARTTWQSSPIPHTHSIWPPVTFSSSPSWSFGWRVEDSTPLKRFKRNRSGYLTQFQKGTSRDASKHGRKAGTAVFVQKWSTLKVIGEFNIQGKQTPFYKYCPGNFGYILVIISRPGKNFILYSIATYKFACLHTKGRNNKKKCYVDLCGY